MCRAQVYSSFAPTSISFLELWHRDLSTSSLASNALVTNGIIQIKDIPGYAKARLDALADLGVCLEADPSSASAEMKDGTKRLSTAAANKDGKPGKMISPCGDKADKLRVSVDGAVRLLLQSLDATSEVLHGSQTTPPFLLEPYKKFVDIFYAGLHLEHMHSYFPSSSTEFGNVSVNTLDLHSDGGLFIAFTPAYYDIGPPEEGNSGLYIQMPTGMVSRVAAEEDSLVVMIGAAGNTWFSPLLGKPLRTVPHKVVSGLRSAAESDKMKARSWYGKMYLPPADALIKIGRSVVRYAEYRRREVELLSNGITDDSVLCSNFYDVGSEASLATSTVACIADDGSEGIYCWATCMSTKDYSCGQAAQCVDTNTNQVNQMHFIIVYYISLILLSLFC